MRGLTIGVVAVATVAVSVTASLAAVQVLESRTSPQIERPNATQLAAPVTTVLTEEVVQRTVRLEADVAPANLRTVSVDGYLTQPPSPTGTVVSMGGVLVEVNGRPIIALPLPFPLYRDMGPGDEGRDVEALQRTLQELGHYPGPVDGRFGAGTSAGIEALYQTIGYSAPPQVGVAELNAASKARRAAERDLEAAKSQMSTNAANEDAAPTDAAELDRTVVAAQEVVSESRLAEQQAAELAGTPLVQSEIFAAASGDILRNSLRVGLGDDAAGLEISSGRSAVVVTGDLAGELRVGQAARVLDQEGALLFESPIELIGPTTNTEPEPADSTSEPSPLANPSAEEAEDMGVNEETNGGGANASTTGGELQVVLRDGPELPQSVVLEVVVETTDGPVMVAPINAVSVRPDGTMFLLMADASAASQGSEVTVATGVRSAAIVEIISDRVDVGDRIVVTGEF